jgi:hypothetical protein
VGEKREIIEGSAGFKGGSRVSLLHGRERGKLGSWARVRGRNGRRLKVTLTGGSHLSAGNKNKIKEKRERGAWGRLAGLAQRLPCFFFFCFFSFSFPIL